MTTPSKSTTGETFDALRLGDQVTVQVAPGLRLRNNETGGHFAEGTPTPQLVTVTLLRRLRDGDLELVS